MGRVTEVQRLRARVAELERNIDSEVSERVATALQGQRVVGGDGRLFDGLTAPQMRAKVVAVAMGAHMIDGASPDAIQARFDHLCDSTVTDPVRAVLMNRNRVAVN